MCMPGLHGQDWTMFGFDLAHTSFNSAKSAITPATIKRLEPKWTNSVGAPLAAAVTLVNGILYVGAWDGNFYAIKAVDGTVLWSQFTGLVPAPETPACRAVIGVTSQAAVVGNTVYVGGGDSNVYALDIATGRLLWRELIADPSTGAYLWSSFTVYNNSLYIGVSSLGDCPLTRGALVRIDLNHPDPPQFKYLVPSDVVGGGIWSTVAIDANTNTIFATTGTGDQDPSIGLWGGTLLAMDAATLEVKNYFFLPSNSSLDDIEWGSSPTLFTDQNGVRLVGATGKDGVLYVLRQDDLTPVWQVKMAVECIAPEAGCGSISTPAFDGKRLYAGGGTRDANLFALGSLYALDPATGDVLWQEDLPGTLLAPVTVTNGLVFAATTMGLEVHDAETGKIAWTDQQFGTMYSQPVVAGGVVYTTYVSGDIIAWHIANPPLRSKGSPR